ncbi:MAG: hypothetical protein ACFB51_12915, partial [Anaerolineae bacterium]
IALLCRELVDWETGLYAAALLAVSWWHIMLGRLAMRISLTPLVMDLAAIPLIRGIRTGSRRSWLWVGVWLGVGVYSYQSMRMAPLVAIAAVAIAAAGPLIRALRRGSAAAWDVAMAVSARQTLNLVCAGLVALTIFMPMLRVWRDYPADLWNRVVNRTTSSEVTIEGSSASVFADNYVDALLMFNVSGDDGWFTGGAGDPALSEVGGLLLLLGVSAWCVRMRVRGVPADTVLVAAILVMLLPSALAVAFPVENPSLTRASGVIPFVFVLMAWPLTLIRQQWHRLIGPPAGPILAAVLIGVLLFGSAAANADTFYASYETAYRQAAPNPGEIADPVHATLGPEASVEGVWIVSWPFWQDHRAVGFELGDFAFDRVVLDAGGLSTQLAESPQRFAVRPLVFILHPDDLGSVALLRSEFPGGDLVEIPSRTPG